ncbi:MAG: hypothetical protein SGILL_010395 [Bacillariaceae sp.]
MTMTLTKRKSSHINGAPLLPGASPTNDKNKGSGMKSLTMAGAVASMLGAAAYASSSFLAAPAIENLAKSTTSSLRQSLKDANWFDIDANVQLELTIGKDASIHSLGPYKATLHTKKKDCPNPGFWLRMEGDALDTVMMVENDDHWEGTFSFPIAGSYQLIGYWKGCENQQEPPKKIQIMTVDVAGNTPVTIGDESSSLYPKSAWISSKKFKDIPDSTPYVWHNPLVETTAANLITTKNSAVSKEGATFSETGFHRFHKLSNYELVCWVGSASAATSREVFLEERRTLFSGQRPFKFHIYPATNFVHPAEDWEVSEQERFRKCKHILVSLDEVKTPLTQKEYAEQVATFLNHLVKAFPDETFPIWMFTVNESPMSPTNCLPPYFLPRTSDHPCNDVLKDLFAESKKTFPDRVHLLDNTAISLPQLGEHTEDVKAAIALRIFVLVGKKVAEWREAGQQGLIDGLHRGDKVEPNFDLVAYEGWK